MEWMILPFKRYADFSGRSCRKEFWMFKLLQYGGLILISMVAFGSADNGYTPSESGLNITSITLMIFVFGTLIPALAVSVRRLHDQGKSGAYYLLCFIPYVGWIVWLIFMCTAGNIGENEYGDDPLNPLGNVQDIFN